MKASLVLVLTCLVLVSLVASDPGRRWRMNRCRRPRVENGLARIRSRGRVVRYKCRSGYRLFGRKFNTCVGRRWLDPHSVCVSSGCRDLRDVDHGQRTPLIKDRVFVFSCDPGYKLRGHQAMFCNGRHWNGTEPLCEAESAPAGQLACDFETQELCGWTHGLSAEFLWTWHSGRTPSVDMFTGPSHDHTLGAGKQGHFLYIEASDPRVENDTARLFSPVFSAAQSEDACFSFWYHMWGSSIGSLRVYILPGDQTLADLPGPAWELSESAGDRWVYEVVAVPQQTAQFQIVIEGVRGASYMGDAAVDDVALKHGDECAVPTPAPATTSATSGTSCRGRCNRRGGPTDACRCTNECLLDLNCCHDYFSICVGEEGVVDDTTTSGAPETVTGAGTLPTGAADNATTPPAATRSTTPSEARRPPPPTSPPTTAADSTTSSRTTPPPTTTVSTTRTTRTTTQTTASTTPRERASSTTTMQSTTTGRPTTSRLITTSESTTTTTAPTTTRPSTTTPPATTQPTAPTTSSTSRSTSPATPVPVPTYRTEAAEAAAPPPTSTISPATEAPGQPSQPNTTSRPPDSRPASSQTPGVSTGRTGQTSTPGTAPPAATSPPPPTTTDLSNELPPARVDDDNAVPQPQRDARGRGGGFPLYAVAAASVGGLLVVAVAVAVVGRRYCRRKGAGRGGRLGGDDDSLVFFAEPDGDEPTLDLRLRSRPESVPSRPAPRAPDERRRPASAELGEFSVEAFDDSSETARLTGD